MTIVKSGPLVFVTTWDFNITRSFDPNIDHSGFRKGYDEIENGKAAVSQRKQEPILIVTL